MSELGFWPKDFGSTWIGNSREKSDFNKFSFSAHEPLRNGKKTIQAFELLNSDVRAMNFGPNYDFSSTWVGNRREKLDFYDFSFSANEPLRNGKTTIQAFELLNSYVRARI